LTKYPKIKDNTLHGEQQDSPVLIIKLSQRKVVKMKKSLILQSLEAIKVIRPFFFAGQLLVVEHACRGREGDFFMQKVVDIQKLIASMPVIGEQDGKGDDAMVYLHYFYGDSHWYITEKDADGGATWAFGYASLEGMRDMAELGYISISDLTNNAVEFDLHFTPCKLGEIKQKLAAAA
jgi:hypothetical protein